MNICAPKDGFVIKVFVKDNAVVKAGSPLLEMDSDWEDRYEAHLDKSEKAREIKYSKHTGKELEVIRAAAQLAIDLSSERTKARQGIDDIESNKINMGVPDYETIWQTHDLLAQAKLDQAKAETQQKQLEFAITRFNQLNELAKKWYEDQKAFLAKRKSLLTVTAPIDGKVTLLAGVGSYAKHGNAIAEIR
jgi:multidrug resistance efflux pump